MKLLVKTLLAAATLAIIPSGAFSQTLTAADNLRNNINQGINANAYSVIIDASNGGFQANYGNSYAAIQLNGRRYLTDEKGTVIINPSTSYVINADGPKNAAEVLFGIDMLSATSDTLISHELEEGVEKKGDLYILSDPTCGYCVKLESEVPTYLAHGIQVHYIPFPRAGLTDPQNAGFSRWAAATCSTDRAKAYYEISTGSLDKYAVPEDLFAECTDVIRKGHAYAQKIGATGTPYMYGSNIDGTTVANPGYLPVAEFASLMGILIKRSALPQ